MAPEGGFIKLYRQIRHNGLWPNNKKYSPLEAWLDLLLSANYNGNKVLIDGRMVTVARGEFITSLVKLSERWGWHRQTVTNFLEMLEREEMILKKSTTKYTSVTIVKYEFYQGDCTAESTSGVQDFPAQGSENCTAECTGQALDTEGIEPDLHTAESTNSVQRNVQRNVHNEELKEVKKCSLYKTPEEIFQEHSRYNESQYKTIRDYWEIIKHTRKGGKVALSIIAAEMEYWEQFSPEIVIESLQTHLVRCQDKSEEYTRGIMRRKARENQDGGKHGQDTGNSGTAQSSNPPTYNRSKLLFKPSGTELP